MSVTRCNPLKVDKSLIWKAIANQRHQASTKRVVKVALFASKIYRMCKEALDVHSIMLAPLRCPYHIKLFVIDSNYIVLI